MLRLSPVLQWPRECKKHRSETTGGSDGMKIPRACCYKRVPHSISKCDSVKKLHYESITELNDTKSNVIKNLKAMLPIIKSLHQKDWLTARENSAGQNYMC